MRTVLPWRMDDKGAFWSRASRDVTLDSERNVAHGKF